MSEVNYSDKCRPLRKFRFPSDLMESIMRNAGFEIPPDAKLHRVYWDSHFNMISVVFEHETFKLVWPGEIIPTNSVVPKKE